MAIPPQRFNELIRGEKLMDCPSCRRIIYWGDDGRLKKQEETPDSDVSE
jgi:predicted  nucleic acid-binding Zn-ribbon protein